MTVVIPYVYRLIAAGTVHDGDTLNNALVDLGWDTLRRVDLRLVGLDTPEVTGPNKAVGLLVRDHVIGWIAKRTGLLVESTSLDKYGRSLAILHASEGETLNAYLLRTGTARPYDGGKRAEWSVQALQAAREAAQA